MIRTLLLFLLIFQNKLFCSKGLFYSCHRQLNQCFESWLPELVTLSSDSTIILSMVCKVLLLFVSKSHKTFRERQPPRPAEIGKCEHWLSVAISTSQLVIRLMVHCIMPPISTPWCDSLTFPNMSHHPSDLGHAYLRKFQSSVKRTKIGIA